MKKLLRASPVQAVVAWLASLYIRIGYATSRWTVIGDERLKALLEDGKPFIGCFWHGRMLNRLTREADRLCGRTPVEPAAEPGRLAAGPA